MKKLLIICILIVFTILISGCSNEKPSTQDLISENNEVRLNAEMELDEMGDTRKTEYFISLLDDDNNKIQAYAKISILEIGEPAIPVLIQALKSDNSKFSIEFIKSEKQENLRNILYSFQNLAVEPLIQALNDKNDNLRYSSARVLIMIDDERAVEPLIQLMLNDDEMNIRHEATRSHHFFKDERAVEPLIQLMLNNDEDENVRIVAIGSLCAIGDKRAVEPLIQLLKDKDENILVRASAAGTLGDFGDIRAKDPLTIALRDENEYVRDAAIGALSKL